MALRFHSCLLSWHSSRLWPGLARTAPAPGFSDWGRFLSHRLIFTLNTSFLFRPTRPPMHSSHVCSSLSPAGVGHVKAHRVERLEGRAVAESGMERENPRNGSKWPPAQRGAWRQKGQTGGAAEETEREIYRGETHMTRRMRFTESKSERD
ncbi:hypothetical protein DPEC_G00238960 [Dallia pectoralis]|uniref:Uncharacterized protein n=1 Tax=Dallia pectoralis TaxID=75939 RepID=A0ACC2FZ49_DALPE|nr:hypothetical protein DPEC_G00238960 [Dallia pectoralis]